MSFNVEKRVCLEECERKLLLVQQGNKLLDVMSFGNVNIKL